MFIPMIDLFATLAALFAKSLTPEDPNDAVLNTLASSCLIVYFEEDKKHADALKARFDKAPKPMYYNEGFLREVWSTYLAETGLSEEQVDPDTFIRWAFARLIEWRAPRYKAIAERWGIAIPASKIEMVTSPDDFLALVNDAVAARSTR